MREEGKGEADCVCNNVFPFDFSLFHGVVRGEKYINFSSVQEFLICFNSYTALKRDGTFKWQMEIETDQEESLLERCLGANESGSKPLCHEGLAKSVEAVVSDSKSPKEKRVLENMVFDRAKTLKASVNAILEEIGLRKDLNERQFGEIDGEVLRLRNRLLQYEALEYQVVGGLDGLMTETKSHVESDVLELEREKRKEELECWRDLMFLKKYLMVSLKDYWELARRWRVLEG